MHACFLATIFNGRLDAATMSKANSSPTLPPLTAAEIRKLVLPSDDFGHEMRVGAEIAKFPDLRYEHGGTYNGQSKRRHSLTIDKR